VGEERICPRDASELAACFAAHADGLFGYACVLTRGDRAQAEDLVQAAFEAAAREWAILRCRAEDMPSAEQGALTLPERRQVVTALRQLPPRQREALVLRYYGDLSEAQIARAMGISRGEVKVHTARAIASLRDVLEKAT
jgi:DNA-directed RNA polymerase specialized sigma24 family protein